MSDRTDRASGKLKEGAGRLTGNEDLEREGRAEQGKGELKHGLKKAKEGLKKTAT